MLAACRIGRGLFQQQKSIVGSTRNLCAAAVALNPIVEVGQQFSLLLIQIQLVTFLTVISVIQCFWSLSTKNDMIIKCTYTTTIRMPRV